MKGSVLVVMGHIVCQGMKYMNVSEHNRYVVCNKVQHTLSQSYLNIFSKDGHKLHCIHLILLSTNTSNQS